MRRFGFVSTSARHQWGATGVDLFFSISGYLITTRILQEESRNGSFDIRKFYIRRAFRILPAALVFLFVVILLGKAGVIPVDRGGVISALLFVRNYYTQSHSSIGDWFTGHFWSLSIEEQFYLALPSVLLFVVAGKSRSIALGFLSIGFFVWSLVARTVLPSVYGADAAFERTEVHLYGIAFASLLAILMNNRPFSDWARRYLNPYGILALVGLIGISFHLLHLKGFLQPVRLSLSLLVVGLVLHPRTIMGRILEWTPLRFVGRLSYSIYLWQQLFFMDDRIVPIIPFRWIDQFPLSYILTFICALASYYCLEHPMIRLGHFFAPPPTPGHRDLGQRTPVNVSK
jgi:peptidoglycan/LPS O-acetylase OafA/YrhL